MSYLSQWPGSYAGTRLASALYLIAGGVFDSYGNGLAWKVENWTVRKDLWRFSYYRSSPAHRPRVRIARSVFGEWFLYCGRHSLVFGRSKIRLGCNLYYEEEIAKR